MTAISASAPLRAVIVDDEPAARRGVRLLLERERDVDIVGEAGDGDAAVSLITRERPDLVFLDVQMPACDGFEVVRRVAPLGAPAVVFITAYDEHALRAFDVHAVDYLLKPYDDDRFRAAVGRARETVRRRGVDTLNERLTKLLAFVEAQQSAAPAGGSPGPAGEGLFTDRILLKSSGEIFFLKADEIDWIEAEGDYMKFHVAGRTHLLRETMARLEERLDPKKFIRIHRSTIVHIDRVRKLSPSFAGEYAVVLHDGTKLKLSRGYQERLQELLKHAL
ncbi:MAG TPA: LytTR family DNA-binding domain-containing protein [Opitutaceae bacterium]